MGKLINPDDFTAEELDEFLKDEAQSHDEDADIARQKTDTQEWMDEQREERGEY